MTPKYSTGLLEETNGTTLLNDVGVVRREEERRGEERRREERGGDEMIR